MPPPSDPFVELVARLRQGDDDAASAVFHRYARRLLALARDQLGPWAGPHADPEDIVQSVYRSFYRRSAAGEFELTGWQALWGLLSVIAVRKCRNRVEYLRAGRRDVRREVSGQTGDSSAPGTEGVEPPAPEPTPLELAMLTETIEHWARDMPERDRRILALHLQGYEIPEISDRVGRTRRTVRRALEQIRRRLDRLLAEDSARA